MYYQNLSTFNVANVTALGATGSGAPNGGAGTVYLQGPGREAGEVVVDNNSVIAPNDTTPIFTVPASSLNLRALKIRRGAKGKIDVVVNVQSGIEVSTDSRLLALDRAFAASARWFRETSRKGGDHRNDGGDQVRLRQ